MTSTPQTKSQAVFSPPKSYQVSQTMFDYPAQAAGFFFVTDLPENFPPHPTIHLFQQHHVSTAI